MYIITVIFGKRGIVVFCRHAHVGGDYVFVCARALQRDTHHVFVVVVVTVNGSDKRRMT